MDTAFQVRPAKTADLPTLIELLAHLFSQEAEFSANTEHQQRGLSLILADERVGRIFVIADAERIHGMVSLLFIPSTALGACVALLEDMVIHPDSRGKGLGTQLLEAALSFAEQADIGRITLLTDHENDSAQHFYERHGFTKSPMLPMRWRRSRHD